MRDWRGAEQAVSLLEAASTLPTTLPEPLHTNIPDTLLLSFIFVLT